VPDTIQELEYDLYYVKNISLSLDALILLQSVKALFL
jgi:lipopolysaccharide/colanic/teichoic acid biosynthesis glycosyltransferase